MSEFINQVLRASVHTFIGRLARDPEARYLDSGKVVVNARIAVNRPGSKRDDGQEPDWFKLELWNDLASAFADACHKGDLVRVEGRIGSEQWTRPDGQKLTQLVLKVDRWEPVVTRQQAAPAPAAPAQSAPLAPPDDDGIPF
jgi:single-strand DNA-binding protein